MVPDSPETIVTVPIEKLKIGHREPDCRFFFFIIVTALTVVCTTADAVQTAERTIKMTVGTNTTWSITFSGVKIA